MKNPTATTSAAMGNLTTNLRTSSSIEAVAQLEFDAHFSADPYEQNSPTAADDAALEIALERGDG
jgi:hypothetical protein